DDADAVRGEITGRVQGEADHPALRCGVCGLADLAVERGDGCGVDDHTALAVVHWFSARHGGGGQPHDVERADQVDLDHLTEEVEVVRALLAENAAGPADAGTVDHQAQRLTRA